MPKLNLPKTIAFSLGVLAMIFSLNYLILAWTEPSATAPNDNVPAPINVGTSTQIKEGNLGVNGILYAFNGMSLNNKKITDVLLPTNGTDAANKNYVDANVGGLVGGTYSSCYVLNSNTNGQTCATGYTSVAWKNDNGVWSFEPNIYGSYNTNATFITIGGQMLQVTFDGFTVSNGPPWSPVVYWDPLSNNFKSPTYNAGGCNFYPNGVAMKLRMTINGISYTGNARTCDANAAYWNGSVCYTSNGLYCNNVTGYVTAGSFALCCK